MNLLIETNRGEKVAVLAVLELESSKCKGCCFYIHDGVYRDPQEALNCNAVINTSCLATHRIYIPDTEEGRNAYITTKLLSA